MALEGEVQYLISHSRYIVLSGRVGKCEVKNIMMNLRFKYVLENGIGIPLIDYL